MRANFLSINNVNSSLVSLSTRVYELQRHQDYRQLEAKVKVFGLIVTDCQVDGDTCECHIVRGDTSPGECASFMWTFSMSKFYVDILNDGSVARVPISMSLTLSD